MLCHTEKIAPGIAVVGLKCVIAKDVAKPEFCIPTSIAIAFAFDISIRHSFANTNPTP